MSAFRPPPGLPLPRLLRLSAVQAGAGMTLVLLDGALNRILIVEMHVPALLVTLMIGAPLILAPARAVIGFRSDVHTSALGWRRTPYLVLGGLVQFGGLAVMPFFLLAMTGARTPAAGAVGEAGALLSFLLAGAGLYATQTAGLALAADLAPPESRPQVVGSMFVALFLGMVLAALALRFALQPYAALRLVKVVQSCAVISAGCTAIGVWRQEPFGGAATARQPTSLSFKAALRPLLAVPGAARTLLMLALGSAAFGLQEVLVEPFGGQVLHMSVASTTALTGLVGAGSLGGFWTAMRARSLGPERLAACGALAAVPAFALVVLSAPFGSAILLQAGMAGVGFGAGLFGTAALNAVLALAAAAPAVGPGLALGLWGAVQALAAGLAVAGGGAARAWLTRWAEAGRLGAGADAGSLGYLMTYHLAIALLFGALAAAGPLARYRAPSTVGVSPRLAGASL